MNESIQELQNTVSQQQSEMDSLKQQLSEVLNSLHDLKYLFQKHQHTGQDETPILTKGLNLDSGQIVKLGLGAIASQRSGSGAPGSSSEQVQTSIIAGKDLTGGFGSTSGNLQLNLIHVPQSSANQSFITALRPPLFEPVSGSVISTTATGNTVTIIGYNFVTNSLAGALIDITDSSGTLVETQVIASNTATVITISGTWINSTSGGLYQIYQPVYLGSADTIWQRFYTQEGTAGGIRFGIGKTWTAGTGQNGLLYMDSTGDLYWRGKTGTSTKLN